MSQDRHRWGEVAAALLCTAGLLWAGMQTLATVLAIDLEGIERVECGVTHSNGLFVALTAGGWVCALLSLVLLQIRRTREALAALAAQGLLVWVWFLVDAAHAAGCVIE